MILVLLPQKHLIGGSVSYVVSEHIFFSRLLDLKLGRGLLLENSISLGCSYAPAMWGCSKVRRIAVIS